MHFYQTHANFKIAKSNVLISYTVKVNADKCFQAPEKAVNLSVNKNLRFCGEQTQVYALRCPGI